MKYKIIFFVALLVCSFPFRLQAQGVIKGFEPQEIFNIAEAYHRAPSLSFGMLINYADSANQDSIAEQMQASYKIQSGMYWAMIDSTEIVQGNSYNVTVFHNDSVIAISNMHPYSNVMQLPLIDSLFRAQNIDSMNVTDINDSTRILRMYFNPASQYSGFIMNYNPNSYLLNSITYFIKTPAYNDSPGSGTGMIKAIFNNYSLLPIDENYFREDKFIYKQGGKFFAQPPYSNFQLMVNNE